MTNIDTLAASRRSTTIITRDGADLHGPRLITDDAAALCVRTFRFADIATVTASGALAVAGAYICYGPSHPDGGPAAYVGESGNLGRRLQEHAADASKAFATEVYVLAGFERRLDKAAAVHMQMRLSELVEKAGAARLVKGTGPCAADLPSWRIATLDRMLADALPQFFDAGCRCLTPPPQPIISAATAGTGTAVPPQADNDVEDADEGGPMEVGVSTTPIGVEEQELAYGNIWARGYEHQDRFVVAAGSEMRRVANASATPRTSERRDELIAAGAVAGIDGLDDRYRLRVAVTFPSRAIAAKVLAGAHVGSDKWRPLQAARRFIIAA